MTEALRFVIDWEPVDASVRAAELRATWCRFELWIDGECLTLAEDSATKTVRHGSLLSLYPVAEWIAFNWWSLCYDGREDGLPARFARRNLRSAGDGFLWPDCEFVPGGAFTLVRWSGGSPPGSNQLRFLSRGIRSLDTIDVQNALANVVETVLARLNEEGIRETPLHKEWRALQSIDPEEAEFCAVAARLGLDPFDEGVELAEEINAIWESVEQPLRVDFFDSAPVAGLGAAAAWLRRALDAVTEPRISAAGFRLSTVEEAVSAAEESELRPWEAGYGAARRLREVLGIEPTEPFPDVAPVATIPTAPHQTFVAAGRRFPEDAAIAIPPTAPAGSRFAVARTLWHAGRSPESAAFLLTTHRSASQRAGRAFAAELLAPAAGVWQLLGPQPAKAPAEDLEQVADAFGVGSLLVKHQIDNQLRQPGS